MPIDIRLARFQKVCLFAISATIRRVAIQAICSWELRPTTWLIWYQKEGQETVSNIKGRKVIIRDKPLVNAINKAFKGSNIEPEDAIESMAPLILAICEHSTMGASFQQAPQAIRRAIVLKEIYSISLEMADHIKPKETIKNVE